MAVGGTNGCWTIWRLRLLAARADLYKKTNGCWAIWWLGHLAVGTFGSQGLKGAKWAVGTWDKWLLGHLMVRKFAIRGQMAVETFCS